MGDTLKKLQLLKKLKEHFPESFDAPRQARNYPDDFYLELLPQVIKLLNTRKKILPCVHLFLYSGCLAFDRFAVPTPLVVNIQRYKQLEVFVSALKKADQGKPINTSVFELRLIRAKLYEAIAESPLQSIDEELLVSYKRTALAVKEPGHPAKDKEFHEEAAKLIAIIDGCIDRSLKTRLKYRIPFVMHLAPLAIDFSWNSMRISMLVTPRFQSSNESFLTSEDVIQSVGPSRWTAGESEIEIEISALFDCDAFTQPLQALHGETSPIDGWPNCFMLAYRVTRDISWQLRLHHNGEKLWIPTPRDISDIEFSIHTKDIQRIEWKRKTSPALLMRVFAPTSEILSLKLGELNEPLWSIQCRSIAIMYFEMGQSEESLFWLNIGVEALFEERLGDIAVASGKQSLMDDIASPKAFWDQSEEIVSTQYPEIAGKIEWPTKEVHLSIYTKLKYLYKNVSMATNYRDLVTQYSKIQKHRNDLFHGRRLESISIESVRIAIESFDWITENFKAK